MYVCCRFGCINTKAIQQSRSRPVSRDPNVHIISQSLIDGLAQIGINLVLTVQLFVPVLTVLLIKGLGKRMAVILLASAAFITALSVLGRARTKDLFMAGAT